MKHLSLQWRITLLTALLIACACVVHEPAFIPHRRYRNGCPQRLYDASTSPAAQMRIDHRDAENVGLLAHFSQEVYDAKVVFGRKGGASPSWSPSSALPSLFVSGRALKPLQRRAEQAPGRWDSIATTRLDENTVQEFGQLSRSVNKIAGWSGT